MKPSLALVFFLTTIVLGAVTDDLAQGLTVGDIHVDQPGLTVQAFLPLVDDSICSPQAPSYAVVADLRCLRWSSVPASDADGAIYFSTGGTGLGFPPDPAVIWRTRTDGTSERVVHVDARQDPSGLWAVGRFDGFTFDLPRGDLYVLFRTNCIPSLPLQECAFRGQTSLVRIGGLPILKPGPGKPQR